MSSTYTQMFTKFTKFEKHWYCKYHTHTYSVDFVYLLPVTQQTETVYCNGCTSLNFTILSESISGIMYLHSKALRYIPTKKLNYST